MWINGASCPDFRTINDFRSSRMKAVIEEVFSAVMEYLVGAGHVKLEHYFLDGTKIEPDLLRFLHLQFLLFSMSIGALYAPQIALSG